MLFKKRADPALDPFERAARRSDPEFAQLEPISHVPLPGLRGKNLLLYFAIGVAVVAVVRGGIGRGAPELARSCTTPAYELSSDSVESQGVLRWSATGPEDSSILFGLDTETAPAASSDQVLAGPLALTDCQRHGQFGVMAPGGDHVVSVWLVKPDGSSTRVGTSKLSVSEP